MSSYYSEYKNAMPKPVLWNGANQGSTADYKKYLLDIQKWNQTPAGMADAAERKAASNPYARTDAIGANIMSQINAANAANEARYQEGKGIMDQRITAGQGYGAQRLADIDQGAENRWGGVQQQLTGRGLGSSSLMATMGMGVEREKEGMKGRAREDITRYQNELLGDKEGLIRSKKENAPGWSDYLQYMQGAGYGSGGGGGGGSGGYSSGYGSQRQSTSRQRPWSPNYNMNQGMDYTSAVQKAAGRIR